MKQSIIIPICFYICLLCSAPFENKQIVPIETKEVQIVEEVTPAIVLMAYEEDDAHEEERNLISSDAFAADSFYSLEELEYILKPYPNFSSYANTFYEVSNKYELNPIYLISKFGLESGWGTSELFKTKNNIGGWKMNSGEYRIFSSPEESIDFIASCLADRYQNWTLEEICAIYCTDDGYYDYIAMLMNDFNDKIKEYRSSN